MVEKNTTIGSGLDLNLELDIFKITANRINNGPHSPSKPDFKVDARLEEMSRKPGVVSLEFELKISTEPAVATFGVVGQVRVQGEMNEIEQVIAINPATQVPVLISEIYLRIYSALYIMASAIKVPYPAAGLLYSKDGLVDSTPSDYPSGQSSEMEREEETVDEGVTEAPPQANG